MRALLVLRHAVTLALLAGVAAMGCRGILGIEEGELVAASKDGGSAGSGGTGGAAGAGGTDVPDGSAGTGGEADAGADADVPAKPARGSG